jgi:hypothetical protein
MWLMFKSTWKKTKTENSASDLLVVRLRLLCGTHRQTRSIKGLNLSAPLALRL